jgi:hypothetical protein
MSETPQRVRAAHWVTSLFEGAPKDPAVLEPFLSLSSVEVYTHDQTLTRQIYLEKLGFGLVFDSADSEDKISRYLRSAGLRWIAVVPMISARPMLLARISHEEMEKGCLFSGISVFVRKTCAQEGGQPLVYRV